MKDPRLWSVLLAAVWFLAGFGMGHLVSSRSTEESPFARYADQLAETFSLDDFTRRTLIQVLDQREAELKEVRAVHEALRTSAMEPDLNKIHRDFDRLIRNTIIPPDQRERYDELAKFIPHTVSR